jgi:aminobenzoyl-glutamate utilization protein A
MQKVEQLVDGIQPELVAIRRDFHKHAESAWTEFRTASIIAKRLTDLGYEVKMGREVVNEADRMGVPDEQVLAKHLERAKSQGAVEEFLPRLSGGFTGVVGILRCGEGPVIGMRFDIDAVDVAESESPDHRPVQEGFASVNPNVMHSCGHDGHATIGLGVAETLMQIKDQLQGTIKLVFQPAEEGVRGAKSVVGSGILDDVDFMIGSHLSSGVPTGTVACGREGFLATSKFDAIIYGGPAHAGSNPEGGHNAMLAAATAVLNLYAIPRHSQGATRVNVGRLNAGTGRNVIPDHAHLAVETRGLTSELNDHMYNYAMRLLENAAAMHGCRVETKHMGAARSGESTPELVERLRKVAEKVSDFQLVAEGNRQGGGSEDYTYMMERVQQHGGQATFISIGADFNQAGHHTFEFDFDETALKGAVKLFVFSALDIMGKLN